MKFIKHSILAAAIAVGAVTLPQIAGAQEVPEMLQQGMPYAEAREILLDAGWQTPYHSPDRERYGAMDYLIELGYDEVVDCAGTGMGFCALEFVDESGNRLTITTVNNQEGEDPTLYDWRLEPEQEQ